MSDKKAAGPDKVKSISSENRSSLLKWLETAQNVVVQVFAVDTPKPVDPRRVYPETVAECIDDTLKYKKSVTIAVEKFKHAQPWKGTLGEIQHKFRVLNSELAKAYEIDEPALVFVKQSPVGPFCVPESKPAVIVMEELRATAGTYSVVAYLHEFGHAIGKDEKGTCRWSLNLFKRHFPEAYNSLEPKGHLLFKKEKQLAEQDIIKPEKNKGD